MYRKNREVMYMADYKGSKCIACGKEFKDDDDIVVCPECGTPYHRICYNKNGKCINETLHASGKAWQPDNAEKQPAKRICVRCHAENPDGALYCCRCGMPFNTGAYNNGARPNSGGAFRDGINTAPLHNDEQTNNGNNQSRYNPNGYNEGSDQGDFFSSFSVNYSDPLCGFNPSEEYENGVTLAELGAYVDSNTHYYLPKFKFMKETGSGVAVNFTALFFPQFYFAYRKMPLMALISMVVLFVTEIPQLLAQCGELGITTGIIGQLVAMFDMRSGAFRALMMICYLTGMVFRLYTSFNGNKLYYRHCLKKIPLIKSQTPENVRLAALHQNGGTSPGLLILFIAIYFVGSMVLSYLVVDPFAALGAA